MPNRRRRIVDSEEEEFLEPSTALDKSEERLDDISDREDIDGALADGSIRTTTENAQHVRLTALKMSNFKSYRTETTIQFSAGVTCVVGPNGAGKSTILEAICFALGLQGLAPGASVITSGEKSAQVELHFTILRAGAAEEELRIQRSVHIQHGRGGVGVQTVGKYALAEGTRPLRQVNRQDVRAVASRLGLDANSERYVIRQGHIVQRARKNPQELLALMEGAAGTLALQERLIHIQSEIVRLRIVVEQGKSTLDDLHARCAELSPHVERLQHYNDKLEELNLAKLDLEQCEGLFARWQVNAVRVQLDAAESAKTAARVTWNEAKVKMNKTQVDLDDAASQLAAATEVWLVATKQEKQNRSELARVNVRIKHEKRTLCSLSERKRLLEEDLYSPNFSPEEARRQLDQATDELRSAKDAEASHAEMLRQASDALTAMRSELEALKELQTTANVQEYAKLELKAQSQFSQLLSWCVEANPASVFGSIEQHIAIVQKHVACTEAVNAVLQHLGLFRVVFVQTRNAAMTVIDHFRQDKGGMVTCEIFEEEVTSTSRAFLTNLRISSRKIASSQIPLVECLERRAQGLSTIIWSRIAQRLQNWMIVDSAEAAAQLMSESGQTNVVTLNGAIFKANGEVTSARSTQNTNTGLESQQSEAKALGQTVDVAMIAKQMTEVETKIRQWAHSFQQVEAEHEQAANRAIAATKAYDQARRLQKRLSKSIHSRTESETSTCKTG